MGYAPDGELEEFAGLLTTIDWNAQRQPHPPTATVPGLRHLTAAIANATRAGNCAVLKALRTCVGFVPWETFYVRTSWSAPFLDDFASANQQYRHNHLWPRNDFHSKVSSSGVVTYGTSSLMSALSTSPVDSKSKLWEESSPPDGRDPAVNSVRQPHTRASSPW